MIERKAKRYMFLTTSPDCPQGDGSICRKKSPKSMKVKDCPHLDGIKQTHEGLVVQCRMVEEMKK